MIVEFDEDITIEKVKNNIIHGDCLSVMRALPDKSIDLIVTSPPYNLKTSTGNGFKCKAKKGRWLNAALMDGYNGYSDDLPYDEYVAWQRECVAEMVRLIKDDGAIFYNNKNRVQGGLIEDRGEILKGFPLRQIIIWHRNGGVNMNEGYFVPACEQIYLVCNKDFKLVPTANRFTDVWNITQEMNNPHPAPFPVALADRIIQSTSAKLVLDPFGGSGTAGVSAKKNGRDFILIEQSEEYCKMAQNRIDGVEEWRNPFAQYISQSLF